MTQTHTQTQPHYAFTNVLDHLKDESDDDFGLDTASFTVDTTSEALGGNWTFTMTATVAGFTTGTPDDLDGHIRDVLADAPHEITDLSITAGPHPDGDPEFARDPEQCALSRAIVVARVTPTADDEPDAIDSPYTN